MVNPLLLLSGIGMMLVGIIAVIYWRMKTKVQLKYFLFGALVWVAAIAVKLLMDLTITAGLQDIVGAAAGLAGVIVFASLYVGLRTGFLESGLSYIAVKKWLGKLDWKKAVAFGVGFGAIEAIFLGAESFLSILIFVINPSLISAFPAELQPVIEAQLNTDTLFIIPAIIERIATMFAHVFAAVLVILAVNKKRIRYFWYSFAYKAVLDGMIPGLLLAIGIASIASVFMIEIPIVVMGLIAYWGIKKVKKLY